MIVSSPLVLALRGMIDTSNDALDDLRKRIEKTGVKGHDIRAWLDASFDIGGEIGGIVIANREKAEAIVAFANEYGIETEISQVPPGFLKTRTSDDEAFKHMAELGAWVVRRKR